MFDVDRRRSTGLGNIELALGELSEAVTVTAETVRVNTESADVSATLGTAQLTDLVVKAASSRTW